ncbi:hypothetical protein FZEAL_10205, partial [Fusarium zealandicum]
MVTLFKPKFHTMLPETNSHDDNEVGILASSQPRQENEITSFDTISPSTVVPLTKLKHWPRAVLCPACREFSITRVERKVCSGTHAMAALMTLCTVVGGPIVYFSKPFKNVEHYC